MSARVHPYFSLRLNGMNMRPHPDPCPSQYHFVAHTTVRDIHETDKITHGSHSPPAVPESAHYLEHYHLNAGSAHL